jgi:hypothetical protein
MLHHVRLGEDAGNELLKADTPAARYCACVACLALLTIITVGIIAGRLNHRADIRHWRALV